MDLILFLIHGFNLDSTVDVACSASLASDDSVTFGEMKIRHKAHKMMLELLSCFTVMGFPTT